MPTQPANIDWDDERVTDREDVVGGGAYIRYTQEHHYETDVGLVALPLASRAADFRLIRLHGGIQKRRVDWLASRAGKPPIVPSAVDTEYDKYLGGTIVLGLPTPNAQTGGYNWTVAGRYVYVEAGVRTPGVSTFPTGNYPYPMDPMDTLANEAYNEQSSAIGTGLSELSTAGATDAPEAPIDVVGTAVQGVVDHQTDNYLWPFTFLTPIFTTDTAIDT